MFSLTAIIIVLAGGAFALGAIVLWARKSGADSAVNKSRKKASKINNEIRKIHDKVDASTADADVEWLQRHSSTKG